MKLAQFIQQAQFNKSSQLVSFPRRTDKSIVFFRYDPSRKAVDAEIVRES